jgi:hypothetical protein
MNNSKFRTWAEIYLDIQSFTACLIKRGNSVDAVQYEVKAHAEFYSTNKPPQQSNKTRLLEKKIEWSIKNKKPGWTSSQVKLSAHDIRWIMGTKEVLNNQCGTSC